MVTVKTSSNFKFTPDVWHHQNRSWRERLHSWSSSYWHNVLNKPVLKQTGASRSVLSVDHLHRSSQSKPVIKKEAYRLAGQDRVNLEQFGFQFGDSWHLSFTSATSHLGKPKPPIWALFPGSCQLTGSAPGRTPESITVRSRHIIHLLQTGQ